MLLTYRRAGKRFWLEKKIVELIFFWQAWKFLPERIPSRKFHTETGKFPHWKIHLPWKTPPENSPFKKIPFPWKIPIRKISPRKFTLVNFLPRESFDNHYLSIEFEYEIK